MDNFPVVSDEPATNTTDDEDQPQDLSSNHHQQSSSLPVPAHIGGSGNHSNRGYSNAQSSSNDGTRFIAFSPGPLRHVLPKIPTRGQNVRNAVSKASSRDMPQASEVGPSKDPSPGDARETSSPDTDVQPVNASSSEYKDPMNSLLEMTRRGGVTDQWGLPKTSPMSHFQADLASGEAKIPTNAKKSTAIASRDDEQQPLAELISTEDNSLRRNNNAEQLEVAEGNRKMRKDRNVSSAGKPAEKASDRPPSKKSKSKVKGLGDNGNYELDDSDSDSSSSSSSSDGSSDSSDTPHHSENEEKEWKVTGIEKSHDTKKRSPVKQKQTIDLSKTLDDTAPCIDGKAGAVSECSKTIADEVEMKENDFVLKSGSPVALDASQKSAPASPSNNTDVAVPSPSSGALLGLASTGNASGAERPKTGRAKTNAELKKQLLEKRGQVRLRGPGGDGGSQGSSPSPAPSLPGDEPPATPTVSQPTMSSTMKWFPDETGASQTVGDMLWARVPGHPFWPCMISPDPTQNTFTRFMSRGPKTSIRQYHVMFFGNEGERGWVAESSTKLFDGRVAFEKLCQQMIRDHPKDKKNYQVLPNRRKAWEIAVSYAEEAYILAASERIERYLRPYSSSLRLQSPGSASKISAGVRQKDSSFNTTPKKTAPSITSPLKKSDKTPKSGVKDSPLSSMKASTKRRHSKMAGDITTAATRASPSDTPPDKKRKLIETIMSPGSASAALAMPRSAGTTAASSSTQGQIQFKVFCLKRRESVIAEHPAWDDAEVEAKLKEQWAALDDDTRSRFIPMGSDMTHIAQMKATPPPSAVATGRGSIAAGSATHEGAKLGPSGAPYVSPASAKRSSKFTRIEKKQKSLKVSSGHGNATRAAVAMNVKKGKEAGGKEDEEERKKEEEGKDDSLRRSTPRRLAALTPKGKPELTSAPASASPTKGIPPKKRAIGGLTKANQSAASADESSSSSNDDDDEEEEEEEQKMGRKGKTGEKKKSDAVASVGKSASKRGEGGKVTSGSGPSVMEGLEFEGEQVDMCDICELPCRQPDVVYCDGPCKLGFHPACVKLDPADIDNEFMCSECATEKHRCFTCKRADQVTERCTEPDCGRFYHRACLNRTGGLPPPNGMSTNDMLGGSKPGYCPLHTCRTCILNKAPSACAGEDEAMYQCVRCPTAYHVSDHCLAAGSRCIAGYHIVCARHYSGSNQSSTQRSHGVISATWCYACEKTDGLIHCDSCPAAYHKACLPSTEPPPRVPTNPYGGGVEWRCQRCTDGIDAVYGDIVWVKFGSYRWWPGEVCLWRYVPTNIQLLSHGEGEFPVFFFGSRDYLWTSRGRAMPFKEGDKCCKEAKGKGLPKNFLKAVSEAIDAYRLWKSRPLGAPPTIGQPAIELSVNTSANSRVPPAASTTLSQSSSNKKQEKIGKTKKDSAVVNDVVKEEVKSGGKGNPKKGGADAVRRRISTSKSQKLTAVVAPSSHLVPPLSNPTMDERVAASGSSTVGEDGAVKHESTCYRCGEGGAVRGALIMCDKQRCTKSYHLTCLNTSKLPHGLWLCPWHHCLACGKLATHQCSRCPNSYCTEHVGNNIRQLDTPPYDSICSDHPHTSPLNTNQSRRTSLDTDHRQPSDLLLSRPAPRGLRDESSSDSDSSQSSEGRLTIVVDDSAAMNQTGSSSCTTRVGSLQSTPPIAHQRRPHGTVSEMGGMDRFAVFGSEESIYRGINTSLPPTSTNSFGMFGPPGVAGLSPSFVSSPMMHSFPGPEPGRPLTALMDLDSPPIALGRGGSMAGSSGTRGKGRPRGSKDTVARKRKSNSMEGPGGMTGGTIGEGNNSMILMSPGGVGGGVLPPIAADIGGSGMLASGQGSTGVKAHRGRPAGSKNKNKNISPSDKGGMNYHRGGAGGLSVDVPLNFQGSFRSSLGTSAEPSFVGDGFERNFTSGRNDNPRSDAAFMARRDPREGEYMGVGAGGGSRGRGMRREFMEGVGRGMVGNNVMTSGGASRDIRDMTYRDMYAREMMMSGGGGRGGSSVDDCNAGTYNRPHQQQSPSDRMVESYSSAATGDASDHARSKDRSPHKGSGYSTGVVQSTPTAYPSSSWRPIPLLASGPTQQPSGGRTEPPFTGLPHAAGAQFPHYPGGIPQHRFGAPPPQYSSPPGRAYAPGSGSRGGGSAAMHGGRGASSGGQQQDGPMFDNSDDEFPDLVIDVPT